MQGKLSREHVLVPRSDEVLDLYSKSTFGTLLKKSLKLTLYEALYLVEEEKLVVKNAAGRVLTEEQLTRAGRKLEKEFWVKYCVFRDLRTRGYLVKTALKFGADFRVYDRGVKPGQDHAKWIVYPVHEASKERWYDLAGKNRVAHSTRKKLLIGIVDEEDDVTYFECSWIRP
ncbi:MAG: tRNA-intron lyase [Candidatus Woesearchaeota archaeon]|nr:tRNA-intron lyase [Candidatus Woesearchaeota archaeon]